MGQKTTLHHKFIFKEAIICKCNTSADLIECIEGGTYSREEALVHASVGFDARFGLRLDRVLLPDDWIQVTPYGGNPVEGRLHLHEVWSKLHFEAAPQVSEMHR